MRLHSDDPEILGRGIFQRAGFGLRILGSGSKGIGFRA